VLKGNSVIWNFVLNSGLRKFSHGISIVETFSALTLLIGWQEGHPACKKMSGGFWHGYLSGAIQTCVKHK